MKKSLLAISCLFLLSQTVFAKSSEELRESRLQSWQKFQKVTDAIEKYYVDELEFQKIIDKTLKGLMQELDAHSAYLDKKSTKEMSIQTKGEFGGLGITVGMRDGALTVISPIDGTPAYKAGVKASDIILKIDEQSTLNMTLDEAVSLMRGAAGTDIVITVVRKGELEPLKIKITRDIIKIQSVFAKKIEDENLLYLRVTNFDRNVVEGLTKAIDDNPEAKGIVLDLRNNPGGLLSQAIGVVDIFVENGVIVSQRGRDVSDEEKFEASKYNTIWDKPVVVLVNGGSASASEIVSGSLQDHKRAIVIGEKTFGKGSVQAVLPITNDRSENIKLTIAKYYLPSGRTIQAVGVTPDVIVHSGEVVDDKSSEFKIKEADLKKHLKGELEKVDGKEVEEKEEDIEKSKVITKENITKDNQLNSAIGILNSLIIMSK